MTTIFKINKETLRIEFKTIKNCKKNIHNSDNKNYYYFNYNHSNNLWENPYCQNIEEIHKKLLKKCKNLLFMLEIFINYDLIQKKIKLEEELKNIVPLKLLKEQYKENYENRKKKTFITTERFIKV